MQYNKLETPALIVDEIVLKQNMQAMNKILEGTGLKLRPHYKSHKCAAVAKMQMESGAIGMTCSKLCELEDLIDIGIEDVLVANQIVDKKKIARVAQLAGDCRITVCVDSEENIRDLSSAALQAGNTLHCLVEYDIGMERCGVVKQEQVLSLAKSIIEAPNLEFDGLQAYAGHISHIVDKEERIAKTDFNHRKLKRLISYLKNNGIEVKTVSGGSTGTAEIKAMKGLYTELQAGSYLFMDATYRDLELPFKNSLFIVTEVISSRDGITVVDAGVKTCGVDQGMPAVCSYGVKKTVASEEHFQLHKMSAEVKPGQRILLIPGHCCSTINLHKKMYLVRYGKVIDRLLITGRV